MSEQALCRSIGYIQVAFVIMTVLKILTNVLQSVHGDNIYAQLQFFQRIAKVFNLTHHSASGVQSGAIDAMACIASDESAFGE